MPIKFKIVVLLLALLSLAGCNRQYSHEYLLQHPDTLQAQLANCRASTEYTDYCDMVKHTTEEFIALSSLRRDNPELFGKQVLQAEMDLGTFKDALQKARQDYDALKAKNASEADLKASEDKLKAAKDAYQIQLQKVKILLAVVTGTSSQELSL